MRLERQSRSEDTFENKHLFILATHSLKTSTYSDKMQSAEARGLLYRGDGYL